MIKVVVVLSGGVIQDVYASEGIELKIVDMDEIGLPEEEIEGLKQVY
jgi:hypothetical protein